MNRSCENGRHSHAISFFHCFFCLFVFMYLVIEFFIVTEQKVIVTLQSFLSAESVSSLRSQCSISGILDYSWYQSWLIKWYKPSTRFHVWAHTYKHSLKCTKIYSALGISVKLTTHTTQTHKFNLCLFINLLNGQPWQASCFIEEPPLSFTVFFLFFSFFKNTEYFPDGLWWGRFESFVLTLTGWNTLGFLFLVELSISAGRCMSSISVCGLNYVSVVSNLLLIDFFFILLTIL